MVHTTLVCQSVLLLEPPDPPDAEVIASFLPFLIMAFLKQDHTSHHTPSPNAGAGVGQIRDWGGCICSFTCDPKERPARICSTESPPFVTSSIFHTVNLKSFFFLIACPLSVAVSSLHCFVYSSCRIITPAWVGRDLIQPPAMDRDTSH